MSSTSWSLLEALTLLPLAFWLALALDRSRRFPRRLFLPRGAAGRRGAPVGDTDRVVVVIPARDEAAVLPASLPSVLAQEVTGGAPAVVLVDDGSTDGTAEVARRLAREAGAEDRLTVVTASPTPPGWAGKVHALAEGLSTAIARDAAWVLLTDADIRHRPGALAALLAVAEGDDREMVSVMARLHAESFWERLLIPPFVYFFHLLYPFRKVADDRSRVAAAAGGCVLVRRAALDTAGGVAAIREAVIDDVALAQAVSRSGGRLWLGLDPGIESVRPYRGLGELWAMVRRSAFVQLRRRWSLVWLVVLGLAVFVVSPPVLAVAALGTANVSAAAGALVAWALQALALRPYVRHHRVPWWWAAGLPAAGALYALMTVGSAWAHRRGRGARWKGRSYV